MDTIFNGNICMREQLKKANPKNGLTFLELLMPGLFLDFSYLFFFH